MSLDSSPLFVLAVVVLVAGAGGLLPFSPTEPLLVAIALVAPPAVTIPAVALATVSQMAMKALLFAGSSKAEDSLSDRKRRLVERVRARIAGRRWLQLLTVLLSAMTGLPPLYLVTLVCGALRLPIRDYLFAGIVGRGIRFASIAMLPRLVTP